MALFTSIETQDLSKISIAKIPVLEDGYIFEAADNEVVEDGKGGEDDGDWFEDTDDDKPAGGAGAKPKAAVAAGAKKPAADDDDIDIDNI